MKYTLSNGINIYNLDDLYKFNQIKSALQNPIKSIIENTRTKWSYQNFINFIEDNLFRKDPNFGLWLGFYEKKIVGFGMTIIINDDNGEKNCILYHMYFKPMFILRLRYAIKFIEEWCKERNCYQITFMTSRNGMAFSRVLKPINFKLTEHAYNHIINKELKYEY